MLDVFAWAIVCLLTGALIGLGCLSFYGPVKSITLRKVRAASEYLLFMATVIVFNAGVIWAFNRVM